MTKKQFAVVLLVALLGGLAGGAISDRLAVADAPKDITAGTIEAQRIRLIDPAGNPGIFMSADTQGSMIAFLTREGNISLTIDTLKTSAGPNLTMYSPAGKTRLSIGVPGETTYLTLYDQREKKRIHLTAAQDWALIAVADKSGTPRCSLGARNGAPNLTLYDKAGQQRATLGVTDLDHLNTGSTETRAESSLVLFNEKGKVLRALP